MPLSGVTLILRASITTAIFKIIRVVFSVVQRINWRLNGTAQKITDSAKPENYESCAHVLDIVAHNQFDILHNFQFEDFICTHNRFESPQFVLLNDHISLLTIGSSQAVFVEAKSKDMLLWQSKHSPFMKNSQVANCRRLIVVPLTAFHRMSEKIGDPAGELIFAFNMGRCGSTLLTQLMEFTGVCVAVSEPDPPNILATRYRRHGDSEELRQQMRDVVRWICRPYKDFKPAAYALKITAVSAYAMPLFVDIYPRARFLYMYRDTLKVAQSVHRASHQLPSLSLFYILGKYSAMLTELTFSAIGFAGEDYHFKLFDDITFGVLLLVRTGIPYLTMRRKGVNIAGVRYEDLIADPEYVCRKILAFCGLPTSLAPAAVQCMKFDSERGSPVSRELLQRHKDPVLTRTSEKAANDLLQKFGLPLIRDECLLEGTISKK